MQIPRIATDDVKRRLDAGEHVVFLDTRADEAWRKADTQIPGSIRVPPDAVNQHLNKIPRDGLLVTYCT
jgi:rhodanese-related sulfurtransferase